MENLALLKEYFPTDQPLDFLFDRESVSFSTSSTGKICVRLAEKENPRLICWKIEHAYLHADLNLELLVVDGRDDETQAEIVIRAEIPPFLRSMLAKPMGEALRRVMNILVSLPYEKLQK
jgi:hypothetical protein